MFQEIDTIVIGGGQAGLVMSYHLNKMGREHVVLERGRVAERWQSQRWNSLHFQFPNWSMGLPGYQFVSDDPNSFSHYSDVARFIGDYALNIKAPVRENSKVLRMEMGLDEKTYKIETENETWITRNVVIATGPFQKSAVPPSAKNLPPNIFQITATDYKCPEDLPQGAVLVVGCGASGCQIADELNKAGRKTFLSASHHRRVPRRYRGKDMFWWFEAMGRFNVTIDSFPNRRPPPSTVVTGISGGYDVNLRTFSKDGVQLLGHFTGMTDNTANFASDVNQILQSADQAYTDFIASANALNASEVEPLRRAEDIAALDSRELQTAETVNLFEENITSVIWATGHQYDFDWVQLPILESGGKPIHQRGVTSQRGVYFLGLHWMHTFESGLLSGVGEDAAYIADHIANMTGQF